MKTFKIPVIYQMVGICYVKAETLDQAKEMASIYGDGRGTLPLETSYIEDSLEIDEDSDILGETV